MARINNKGRIDLNEKEEALLFSDCNGLCSLCGKPLLYNKNKGKGRGFQAAHIYPHSPTEQQRIALQDIPMPQEIEGIDNIILLCERCHNTQDFQTTKQDYLRLYDIKQKQLKKRLAKESVADIVLETEIEQVLDGLKDIKQEELKELNMIPVAVKQKVSDLPLQCKIHGYVSQYFNYIKTKLQELDVVCSSRSEAIAKEISLCFTKAKGRELFIDQNAVFDTIVNWLISKTDRQRSACEAVVAYYVQDCEVFDASSK